jgi:lysophospholipase L1-like esterase
MKKHTPTQSRRSFLQQTALGAGLGITLPPWLNQRIQSLDVLRTYDEANTIVFQGDSITDAGRDKENQAANSTRSLGRGYVNLIVSQLLGEQPGQQWQCFNRGISGNKVFQLAERWQADCLDLEPDVLSILIGVNDFWHTLSNGYEGTAETYEQDFRTLLSLTKEVLPDVELIIGEPFALAGGSAIVDTEWYPKFNDYRTAARAISDDFGAVWIPYQSLFDEALEKAPVEYWCPDGVHPAIPGAYLMAQAWLEAFGKVMG